MGHFDGLISGSFKKDASDKTVFYPWGVLGSGYILDSDETRTLIYNKEKKAAIIGLPAGLIMGFLIGVWVLVLVPIYVVWRNRMISKMVSGCPRADSKLKVAEAYQNSAKGYSLRTLVVLEICSIGFLVVSLLGFYFGEDSNFLWMAMLSLLCAFAVGFMIFLNMRKG